MASRGVALVVDAFAIVAGTAVVGGAAGLVAAVVGGLRPEWLAQALLSLATVAIAVGYFALFWQTAGQTPGMRLMDVRVLSRRGDGRLTGWQALLRTIGLALAIIPCFLGFVPALFDRRRRALPDYLAGTVVVYDDAGIQRRGVTAGGNTPPDNVAGKARQPTQNIIERRMSKFLREPPSVRLAANVIVTATWSSSCSAA